MTAKIKSISRLYKPSSETDHTPLQIMVPYLPDSTEISQIENVMELGRRRQHLDLSFLPELSRSRHQRNNHFLNFCLKTALVVEVATAYRAEDLIDGSICGKSAVKNGELPLQTARNVITTSTRLYHGCYKLNVDDVREFTGFVETVESLHLHDLPHNFVSNLKTRVN